MADVIQWHSSLSLGRRRMNKHQVTILWCGIVVLALMLSFPPWKYTYDIPGKLILQQPGPYNLILTPPEVPVTSTVDVWDNGKPVDVFYGYDRRRWIVSVDLMRLGIQCVVVVLVIAGLLATSKPRTKKEESS